MACAGGEYHRQGADHLLERRKPQPGPCAQPSGSLGRCHRARARIAPSTPRRCRFILASVSQNPITTTTAAEAEQLLRDAGALLEGHFKLASGKHSPLYVEKFRLP